MGALAAAGRLLAAVILVGPVAAGLLFTLLPAFGWLPALGGERPTLQPFADLLAAPGVFRSAGLSFATGLAATFLSGALAALFLAGFWGTKPFERLQTLLSPLLALPHAAAAFALAFLVAPSGFVFRLVSPEWTGWTAPPDILIVHDPWGLTLTVALVVKEVPFLLLVALAALPQTRATETARLSTSLGYGRVAGFLFGIWPLLYRQIRLAVLAVLAFSTSVVDMAVILGPTLPPTLSVRIVEWSLDPDLSKRFLASAGAVLQLGVSGLAILAWIAGERLFRVLSDRVAERGRRLSRDGLLRGTVLALQGGATASLYGGLAVLGLWSAARLWPFPDALPQNFTIETWVRALPRLAPLLGTSMLIAGIAAAVALLVAVLAFLPRGQGRPPRNIPAPLLFLPLLVPQTSFLFGLQLLFLVLGALPDASAVVAAHLVFVLPYAMLSLGPPWASFDPRFEQVAASLGRGPWAALLRVRLPMLLPALLTAFAIGFAVSAGLYLPTLLVGGGRVATVTTEAVALASGGNRRVIGAYALVQAFLPALGFALALLVPRALQRLRFT
ncbi:MAG TPA: ABC transporter permease [Mesorhizobium sp.]|jgi:putative thiamine transport system permease protein|nr:ABC transporter permease [Mesorhizobium sp.]